MFEAVAIIAVAIAAFLIGREVVCWYFKFNLAVEQRTELTNQINALNTKLDNNTAVLQQIVTQLENLNNKDSV